MILDTVGKLCREFKILRQKSNLNIDYNLGECLKHSFDLVKLGLNYKSNVDIVRKESLLNVSLSKTINCKTLSGFENLNTYHVKSLQA